VWGVVRGGGRGIQYRGWCPSCEVPVTGECGVKQQTLLERGKGEIARKLFYGLCVLGWGEKIVGCQG